MSIASEGKRLTFLLMIISDLIPVFFFQLVLADDEDLQKEHVDLEKSTLGILRSGQYWLSFIF